MSTEFVLSAEGLSKSFFQAGREIKVLSGVDLQVKAGESVAVVGVSGSGKSTLLHLLAGLDKADAGSVHLAGQKLSTLSEKQLGALRNKHVGFIYQFHHLLSEFNAQENVAMPLMIGGVDRKDALAQAASYLDKVNLSDRLDHHPSALSGGERQRVAIARALVTTPDVVLADEPTGNLDEDNAEQIHELMLSLSASTGIAFVVVTHDQQFAARMQRSQRLHGGVLEST